MATLSLSGRFEAFVQILDQFESVDALLRGSDPIGQKRADYLLANRRFIIGQKVLVSDPEGRPQRFVDKLANERGIRFYSELPTDHIFSEQHDAQDLQRRLVLDLARGIDEIVAYADKQTADTRRIFNITEAAGILVILNEGAGQLPPDVINYTLHNAFQKKTPEGAFTYAANNGVILISEANWLDNHGPAQIIGVPHHVYWQSGEETRFCSHGIFRHACWEMGKIQRRAFGDDVGEYESQLNSLNYQQPYQYVSH